MEVGSAAHHTRKVSPGGRADDLAVAAMPEDWTPVRSTPGVLPCHLEARGERHARALAALQRAADAVNERAEARMRSEAEVLRAHVQQYDADARHLASGLVHESDKGAILSRLDEVWKQKLGDIDDFKAATDELECRRGAGLRELLGVHFKELVDIGHRPPYELLQEFQQKIYAANQQLVCNARAHAELHEQLLAQAGSARVAARSKLEQTLLERGRHQSRSLLDDDRGSQRRSRSATGIRATDSLTGVTLAVAVGSSRDDVGAEAVRAMAILGNRPIRTSSESSLSWTYPEIEQIGECVPRLRAEYKGAVRALFSSFHDKLRALREDLRVTPRAEVSHHGTEHLAELQRLIDLLTKEFRPDAGGGAENNDQVTDRATLHLDNPQCHNIHAVWLEGAQHLTCWLQRTYGMVRDAMCVWRAHARRVDHARRLARLALEDAFVANDSLELASEVSLNIAIEELRQSSDLDKLDKQYDAVETLLNNLAELYRKHHEGQEERLGQHWEILEVLISALLADFRCFLDKYPKRRVVDGYRTPDERRAMPQLPPALLQAELQVGALFDVYNGFLDELEENLSKIPEEVRKQTAQWIGDVTKTLMISHAMKLLSHRVRVERIRVGALERRRDELLYHERRLNSHLQAMTQLVEELWSKVPTLFNFDSPDLFPLSHWLEDIHGKINEGAPNELKLLSYQQRLSRLRREFEASLDAAAERFRETMSARVQGGRHANMTFLSHLQLFSEGGQFSGIEATRAATTLARAGDVLEAAALQVADALDKHRADFLQAAALRIQVVENVVNESMLEFRNPRPAAQSKAQARKPPPKK